MHTSKTGARAAMRGIWRLFAAIIMGAGAAPDAIAQALPLEIRQDAIRFNLSSTNGLPLSSVRGNPPGSDGRAPTVAQQQAAGLTEVPATTNQFRGLTVFGGVIRPGTTNLNPGASLAANVENLDLPRIKVNGQVVMSLLRGRVGAPMLGRAVSFSFGEIIPPPNVDEYGVLLSVANTNVVPPRPAQPGGGYWLPEPYVASVQAVTGYHTNTGYYWSPHAQTVFAINPGPLFVVWRRGVASTAVAPAPGVGTVQVLGVNYTVMTNQYVVSGSPVKPPRLMYWTERSFTDTGKPIAVPSARVGAVNVVYNNNFPEKVADEVTIPGAAPLPQVGTNGPLQELRTLWFDETGGQAGGQLRAYNVEGRVFMELLGDVRQGVARQHLGFEIVDVIRQPAPNDVTVELGDRVTAYPRGEPADDSLFPEPLFVFGGSFAYQHTRGGEQRSAYYATRETRNQNDYQIHWMEEGLQGLKWPLRFVRYRLVWPEDVARYSHYVRPLVATEAQARSTAVQLPSQNAPFLEYQDALDQPRGRLTETFAYYSFLSEQQPAHRALLRFTSGEYVRFERIFSWLDQALRTESSGQPAFAGSVAASLSAYTASNRFYWPNESVRPRVVNATVSIGDRITAPPGEIGNAPATNYLAGFIRASEGDFYHPTAYVDPFSAGFDAANRGAILPVNSMPGRDRLEVWWFRQNAVNTSQGFQGTYWPAVIGRYQVQWPSAASEIILAGNSGSGPLASLEAKGSIYYQNDRSRPGYNPNEEHALMQGGQVYALRDDLNITSGTNLSSRPFVLLQYTTPDGRLGLRPFAVLREKGNIRFEYDRVAGTILQAPMPLPLMGVSFAPKIPGTPLKGLNEELVAWDVAFSAVDGNTWTLVTEGTHGFLPQRVLALQDVTSEATATRWVYATGTSDDTVTGVISSNRPGTFLAEGRVNAPGRVRWSYIPTGAAPAPVVPAGTAMLFQPSTGSQATVDVVSCPTCTNGSVVLDFGTFMPPSGYFWTSNSTEFVLVPMIAPLPATAFAGWRLAWNELPRSVSDPERRNLYARATVTDRKGNLWVYRGPHQENRTETFSMRFYYDTLPGFFFPSLDLASQPPAGTPTPYLRRKDRIGNFVGDPVYGNGDRDQAGDDNALPITYHPVWPANAPVLQMAETLTTPKRGLAAVRGQSSLQVLYQQSQVSVTNGRLNLHPANASVILHDPTARKMVAFDVASLPAAVKTETSRGRIYFPNLPPHLVKRFWLDPNEGVAGALVFTGEFIDASVGDKYVLLNVAGQKDRDYLHELCPTDVQDPKKGDWDAAVDALALTMEKFVENPAVPGTYIPLPSAAKNVGLGELAEVTDDDVAVDSYALTAVGPGTGYVSLIAGNGEYATPAGDPVSINILRVVPALYRGEVNIVESDNPLNESLTLQQVTDLAARAEDYRFEWRIAAPVDGLPPAVYQNSPVTLMGDGVWSHLRFPQPSDSAANVASAAASRVVADAVTTVVPVGTVPHTSVAAVDGHFRFEVLATPSHGLVAGNRVVIRKFDGTAVPGTVTALTTDTAVDVAPDAVPNVSLTANDIATLGELVSPGGVQSILHRQFVVPAGSYSEHWLSLELDPGLGARVYIDGQLVVRANTGADDTVSVPAPGGLFPLSRTYRVPAAALAGGTAVGSSRRHSLAVELISGALPGQVLACNARLEAFAAADVTDQQWLALDPDRYPDGVRAILGGTADVRSLSDNYVIMRYQPISGSHASFVPDGQGGNAAWSQWTSPQLAEGWIKRVLKGVNPFNQRVTDLFNNAVSTDVSIVAQAGARWEGDVALNLEELNRAGLIEIYETVLNRGKMLSIGGGINYGPANDALLLAAGYLNDLYMMLGNEALADASNPTIGIGTKDNTYGAVATALFSFKGQLPSLLEEELALLRGRDDFLLPGVELRPVYNRLPWNYTRGIDAGEVVYSLNYNILDQNTDGRVDAEDARRLYPQGHGDAYGHYLTALKGYYGLLMDGNFDWVPRIEAVTVLGKPVSVDYQDERKFAAAAGALARAGRQIFDLTWRRDFQSSRANGWSQFATKKENRTTRGTLVTTRYWGMDHWAARTGQGAYLNWIVGNAILPDRDPDPAHQGSIQQIDRTTVPELKELPVVIAGLQAAMDNAEGANTPLGLPVTTIPFDLNPNVVVGQESNTHFEQIYARAKRALNNAIVSFDDAKDVTRLMRSEQDSLAEFRTVVNKQELAYTNALIELYGTAYPDDTGPGRTYPSGFAGPDTIHYMYVDNAELNFNGLLNPAADTTWRIDTQTFTPDWLDEDGISDFNFIRPARVGPVDGTNPVDAWLTNGALYVEYNLASHGFFKKPAAWVGRRSSPGKIQQAISDVAKARNAAYTAFYWADAAKYDLDWALQSLQRKIASRQYLRDIAGGQLAIDQAEKAAKLGFEIFELSTSLEKALVTDLQEAMEEGIPLSLIAGLAAGGDVTSAARMALGVAGIATTTVFDSLKLAKFTILRGLEYANQLQRDLVAYEVVGPEQWRQELRDAMGPVRDKVYGMNNNFMTINARLQELDDAQRRYRSLLADGLRIQQEREIFRQRAASVIQGYRTRDAAFRVFRNEKLERYKTLFDLAAQYAFMAAQAYDYETGLLHTDQGQEFINRIVRSRALGIVQNGEPQFAGSNTGDPGLSSAMAEMFADWTVAKGRLGFNNPDAYGTTVSLRSEHFRILPGTNGNTNWKDVLNQARKANLLDDPDIRRYCLQIDAGNGMAVPGLVLEFSTTISRGLNLFGQPLAAGDHAFSPSAFATKIFAAGVALEGYQGMSDPAANAGAGGNSPPDPNLPFLDPNYLAATPYVYLVPVGVDSMRSPALGDTDEVRTWSVDDVAIPLPFNIGGSAFSSAQIYQSADSLSEAPFVIRKHQAFRPVSSASLFSTSIYAGTGGLTRSQWTNNRLVGRSVWNSKWKLVIPGETLLNNPNEGLERLIRTLNDVKIHFVTYSYSGN